MQLRHEKEVALRAHYDSHPEYYSPLAYPKYFHRLCEALQHKPDTGRVLDLGCGDGRLLDHIWPIEYIGVDYSEVRIDLARKKWCRTFFCDDLYRFLSTDQDQYTLTVAVEILEHLEEPKRVVAGALAISDAMVGTVPVNLPYKAHLQVYKNMHDVLDQLGPTRVVKLDKHWGCLWLPSTTSG